MRRCNQFPKRAFCGFVPIEVARPRRAFDHSASSESLVLRDSFESIPHRIGGKGIEHADYPVGNLAERWNRRTGDWNPRCHSFN
jgi:hypothetical protein